MLDMKCNTTDTTESRSNTQTPDPQTTDSNRRPEVDFQTGEERFRLAFENANIGMCFVDLQGRLLRVNAEMSSLFGYSRAELEAMTVNDLTIPEDAHLSADYIRTAIEGNQERLIFEKRYRHRQGRIIYGLVSASLVHDAQGRPLYFISQVQDITERKRIERAASAKSAFISRMSDELRAPLHIILGFNAMLERLEVRSQAVAEADDLSRKRLDMLDAVQRNTRHLLSLVNEVLDFNCLDQEAPGAVRVDDSADDLHLDPGGVDSTCRVPTDLRADWSCDAGSGVGPASEGISYLSDAHERRVGEDRDLVLVIDDELDTLRLTFEMLSDQGLRMIGARDGVEGLRLAAARQPQLVLLDSGLPGLDGFQVCARLRAEPATQDIPVIVLSARDQVEDRARGFAAGAVDYVVKPFDLRELRLRLINHLRLSRQSRSLGCEAVPGERDRRDGAEASLLSRRALNIFICARDRMLADLNATPDLTRLARDCGTNRTSLQHLFQTQLGLSVFGYLREQRLQRVLVLLREGRGVDAVAQEVGYGSGHSLSRAFKQRFGIPPGALSRVFQDSGL